MGEQAKGSVEHYYTGLYELQSKLLKGGFYGGFYRDNIGIMEKNMEIIMVLYRGHYRDDIGIMEKKMEITIMGLYRVSGLRVRGFRVLGFRVWI